MYQLALPHTQLAAQFRDAAYAKQYEQNLSDWVEDAIGGHSVAAIRPEIAFIASAATTIMAASILHDARPSSIDALPSLSSRQATSSAQSTLGEEYASLRRAALVQQKDGTLGLSNVTPLVHVAAALLESTAVYAQARAAVPWAEAWAMLQQRRLRAGQLPPDVPDTARTPPRAAPSDGLPPRAPGAASAPTQAPGAFSGLWRRLEAAFQAAIARLLPLLRRLREGCAPAAAAASAVAPFLRDALAALQILHVARALVLALGGGGGLAVAWTLYLCGVRLVTPVAAGKGGAASPAVPPEDAAWAIRWRAIGILMGVRALLALGRALGRAARAALRQWAAWRGTVGTPRVGAAAVAAEPAGAPATPPVRVDAEPDDSDSHVLSGPGLELLRAAAAAGAAAPRLPAAVGARRESVDAADAVHGLSGPLRVGTSVARLESAPPPACALCLNPREHATATPCGHVFCWGCIARACFGKPECPVCRQYCLPQELLCLVGYA